ncbi:AraC-like protein [Psychrobacillus insolitus]|uniref:AraC-like protein n=1 Tax=Psychrobacillus insolitus TaxID=1461 RepID=A0A2W7MIS0_9BACI|nr:AraC family ligand binding domain-containing protein [Psychrobacillus insolitus]PZX02969.1 AraC-like protein [Psychrobacillus insolitus]
MHLIETPYLLEEKEKNVSKVIQFDNNDVVNIQLRIGEEIKEHNADAHVLIVIRRGKVIFTVEGVEQVVTTNNVLHMNPLEKHALKAVEDSDIVVIKIGN